MGIFSEFLTKLNKGDQVRITQTNGQIMEGVVTENDGEGAIALQVVMNAVVKYSCIDSVSLVSHGQAEIQNIADLKEDSSKEVPAEKDIDISAFPKTQPFVSSKKLNFYVSEEDFGEALGKLDESDSAVLKSTYEAVLNEYGKYDSDKGNTQITVANLIKLAESDRINDFRKAYIFAAYGAALLENFRISAEYFYYGDELRNAYLSAYEGAYRDGDENSYQFAAAFSVLYILYSETEKYLEEAAACLRECCVKCKDISGIEFIFENAKDNLRKAYAYEVLRQVAEKAKAAFDENSVKKSVSAVKEKYSSDKVLSDILQMSAKKSQIPAQKAVKKETKPVAAVQPEMVFDTEGKIVSLNAFRETGQIIGNSGSAYEFDFKEITDDKTDKLVKNIIKKSPRAEKLSIDVSFTAEFSSSKLKATNIKGIVKAKFPAKPSVEVTADTKLTVTDANRKFSEKKYEEAFEIYKKLIEEDKSDEGFAGCINCCLAMLNQNSEKCDEYKEEVLKIIDEYDDKLNFTMKMGTALIQIYTRFEQWQKCIDVITRMEEKNIFKDDNQRFHHMGMKAGAYRRKGDLKQAINIYLDMEKFVEKNKMYSKQSTIKDVNYVEISEMYIELGDYQQAKYFYDTSGDNAKKPELKRKLEILGREQNKISVEDETDFEESVTEPSDEETESVNEDEAKEEEIETVDYIDESAFDNLIKSDREIINTAFSFKPEQLYCTITYLAAAAEICENSISEKVSDCSDMPMSNSLISASRLVNSAYSAYGFAHEQNADKLIGDFVSCQYSMPEYSTNLFGAALLRETFGNSQMQSFEAERLIDEFERAEHNDYTAAVSALVKVFNEFREKTAYCIDMFADYNIKNAEAESVIKDATECSEYISQRVKAVESQGRVRRARELIFHDESSILKQALDAVCQNDVSKSSKIKKSITEMFMRNDEEFSVENTDIKKIDRFIDEKWDESREIILSENRHLNRPYDNLKGGKRNNIVVMLKRVIDCVCRWSAVSESVEVISNKYYTQIYEGYRDYIIDNLENLIELSEQSLEENFDWGIHSIGIAAAELLAKMEGTYEKAEKKYMYIDFLKSGHVLLDDNYIPDISATFSDLPEFNIFARIKAHTEMKLPDFKYRVQQIFSDNIHNHNFRSVNLIKNYASYKNERDVSEHSSFEYFDACVRLSRQRTTHYYKDFKNELELYESYGSISNITGYKSFIARNIDAWYALSIASGDFGFFSDIIEEYKQNIAKNAESTANRLMQQLNDIANDENYDFGIYSKEKIKEYIEDRNFSIAENILNCIRRGDIKSITDFAKEPVEIFKSFMAEYETLHRAVSSDSNSSLQKALCSYYNTRNVERALQKSSNIYGVNKELRGGTSLVQNWPASKPAGAERISKIISQLGFAVEEVKDITSASEDMYNVKIKKKTGKVNYSHPIPAYGSLTEHEGMRVLFLDGRFNTDQLIDKFRELNSVSQNTIVMLNWALSKDERRRFARKIKEEKSLSKTFLLIDRVLLLYLAKHYQANSISRMLMAAGMPFAYNQPFCPKANVDIPAELFTGRQAELELIKSYSGANLIYGGRQLGKSSLLKMAAYEIDGNEYQRAVVISIKGRNYTEAALRVSQELVMNDILPEGSECSDWDILAMHIRKRLKDQNSENKISYLLLMLDEADEFIASSKEIDYRPITLLKEMLSPNFKFVLAGLHNLSKFDHEFYSKNYDFEHLGSCVIYPFKRPEATELLTHCLAYLGFVFSDEVINLILAKTNYFPGLLHLYGQKLILAMTNEDYAGYSETETPCYEVTESHIKKVLSDPNFKDEIKGKLRMTLEVEGKENSPYYVIALVLAYLYYEEENKDENERKTGFKIEEVVNKAKSDEINMLLAYSREQITELFKEMWDLNILTSKDDLYMFSTEGFRELLGTREDVNTELSKYMGGRAE